MKIKEIPLRNILISEDDSVQKTEIIASLRIDAVLAGLSKNSRGQIKKAIKNKLVKINWHGTEDSNIMVKVGDVLSLRHFGRSKIMDISATRKGKYKVVLKVWQTKRHG